MKAGGVRSAAVWALVSQYTSFAIQFVTSVVLARWFIAPEQLGQFAIAFAAVTLVALLQDFGVTRYINGETDLTDEKLRTAFTVSITFAWTIALISVAAAWPITWFYGDPALLPLALIISSSYFFVPLAIIPQALCQRRLDYKTNTIIEVGSAVANAAVALSLAAVGFGALALAWGAFAQQLARMAISQWRAGGMIPWPLRLGDVSPIMALGATNSAQAVCGTISLRAPELVIGPLISTVAVGLFTRASGLALQLRTLVAGAVTSVFYPAFRHVRDQGEALGPPYLRVVASFTGITWPAMAGIALLAEPLIHLLYGQRWMGAAPLLFWIALAQLFFTAVPLNGDLPMLLGRMKGLVKRGVIETAAGVIFLLAAAPFGLIWVAVARLAHALFWAAVYLPFLHSMLHFSWRKLGRVYAHSALATLAAITPLIIARLFLTRPEDYGVVELAGLILTGIALWLGTIFATRHSLANEISALWGDLRLRLPFTVAQPKR